VISLARYAALLDQPALRSAIAASVLGRLPIGIAGLAILMLAQDTTGSFARGGAIAACYVAGLATVAPLLGRLIDRYGPRPTLLACAFAFPTALAALIAEQPDRTLVELQEALGIAVSIPTICRAVQQLGLNVKKNRTAQRARPA